jgi:hypothetical protein
MSLRTRREILRVAGGVGAAGIAGCSTLGSDDGDDGTQRLGELSASNFRPEPRTVHVVVLDDDEPTYWRSERVPAAVDDDPGGVAFEDHPTDPGDTVLHARVEGYPRSEWEQYDFVAAGSGCLGLQLRIGDFVGDRPSELSIWKTRSSRVCDETTTE